MGVEYAPDLLELSRHIHLNPARAGRVPGLPAFRRYPWTGHAALLGKLEGDWQDTATILTHFGRSRRRAVARYEAFGPEGLAQGRRPDRVGGGAQVLSLRWTEVQGPAGARILGSGAFIEAVPGSPMMDTELFLRAIGRRRSSELVSD